MNELLIALAVLLGIIPGYFVLAVVCMAIWPPLRFLISWFWYLVTRGFLATVIEVIGNGLEWWENSWRKISYWK